MKRNLERWDRLFKNARPLRLILLLFCAVIFSGCSTVSSRIAANPETFNRLPAGERALVQQGEIRERMAGQSVFLAWGKPDTVCRGSAAGHGYETWIYLAYNSYPGLDYGYGPGCFRGNWNYYPVYQLNYPAWGYPYRLATFVNGKVVAWSTSDWP